MSHDKEVADALGNDCILVVSGHQGKNALLVCKATVVEALIDVIEVCGVT